MKTKYSFICLALFLEFSLFFGIYNYQKQQAVIEKVLSPREQLKMCGSEMAKSRYEAGLYFSQKRAREKRTIEAQLEFLHRKKKAQIR